ncbi:WhiB family transcriptional regulator [Arthrobacter burdickii]|uniref:WhiB family transcriptional regulator n=1 Tax=Arthrobacter burdickii TaxID=3035920 RepID=UPI00344784F3
MTGADPSIDSRRGAAHRAFLAVVEGAIRAGGVVPCVSDGAGWLSSVAAEQEKAARECRRCPALAACWQYENDYPERSGVYAGRTENERKKGRR